ncbi:hypothetical protein VTK56DRAFT_9973 [Thermocarpiscus australiensis]
MGDQIFSRLYAETDRRDARHAIHIKPSRSVVNLARHLSNASWGEKGASCGARGRRGPAHQNVASFIGSNSVATLLCTLLRHCVCLASGMWDVRTAEQR